MAALPTARTRLAPLSAVSWGCVNHFAGGKEAAAYFPKDLMAQCGRTLVAKAITLKGQERKGAGAVCFFFFYFSTGFRVHFGFLS